MRGRWDIDGVLPVPLPGWLACPVCRAEEIQAREWMFHVRKGSHANPYRCDVSFKCCDCSAVWWHGVAVPQAMFDARKSAARIDWRRARELLTQEQ